MPGGPVKMYRHRSVFPAHQAWGDLARHWFQLFASGDPEQVSAASYGDYEDTGVNWPVLSGYGDLFERMARGLTIRTGVRCGGSSRVRGPCGLKHPKAHWRQRRVS
jgi:hypothetical protein